MPINNITQTISELPPAGSRGVDVQSIFVTKQEDFQDHLQGTTVVELNALVTQQNTMAGAMNSTATQVNTNANTATTQAGIATTRASQASTSASQASTSASQASTSASQASTSASQAETFAQQASASALSLDANNIVYRTGNQTIDGIKTFSSGIVVPTPTTDAQAATKKYVDDATDRIGLIDYGYVASSYHIVAFGGEFSRANYPKLWAYLQANPSLVVLEDNWQSQAAAQGGIVGFFSYGNATTTFRVPNLDKAFLRPDSRGVGSYQGDAIRNITGVIGDILNTYAFASGVFVASSSVIQTYGTSAGGDYIRFTFDASRQVPTADENRPKNIAVLPLIVVK